MVQMQTCQKEVVTQECTENQDDTRECNDIAVQSGIDGPVTSNVIPSITTSGTMSGENFQSFPSFAPTSSLNLTENIDENQRRKVMIVSGANNTPGVHHVPLSVPINTAASQSGSTWELPSDCDSSVPEESVDPTENNQSLEGMEQSTSDTIIHEDLPEENSVCQHGEEIDTSNDDGDNTNRHEGASVVQEMIKKWKYSINFMYKVA